MSDGRRRGEAGGKGRRTMWRWRRANIMRSSLRNTLHLLMPSICLSCSASRARSAAAVFGGGGGADLEREAFDALLHVPCAVLLAPHDAQLGGMQRVSRWARGARARGAHRRRHDVLLVLVFLQHDGGKSCGSDARAQRSLLLYSAREAGGRREALLCCCCRRRQRMGWDGGGRAACVCLKRAAVRCYNKDLGHHTAQSTGRK